MVEVKQNETIKFSQCTELLNKYFDVWDGDMTVYLYERKHKNIALQYLFGYLASNPLGWLEYTSKDKILTIYGSEKTFIKAAKEIEEKLKINVVIITGEELS
jgi:hypothetical protein